MPTDLAILLVGILCACACALPGCFLLPYMTGQKSGAPRDTLIWRSGDYQAILSKGWKMQRSKFLEKTRLYHVDVYTDVGLIAVGCGIFLAVITPLLKKLMHGSQ